MSTEAGFKVRFGVKSEERLDALMRAYDRIRECKSKNVWPESKEEWTPYFDSKALLHFWWPTPQEFEDWTKRYFSTPVPRRFSDPTLQHPWDFLSLFEAFKKAIMSFCLSSANRMVRSLFFHLTRSGIHMAAPAACERLSRLLTTA